MYSDRVQSPNWCCTQAFAPQLYQLYFGHLGGIHDTFDYHYFDVYADYSDYGSRDVVDYGISEPKPGNGGDGAVDYDYSSDYHHSGDTSSGHDYDHLDNGSDPGIGSYDPSDYTAPSDYYTYDYSAYWRGRPNQPVLVTSNALRAAQEHFNCSELTGVPLEEFSLGHLDQRVFQVCTCNHSVTVVSDTCMQWIPKNGRCSAWCGQNTLRNACSESNYFHSYTPPLALF